MHKAFNLLAERGFARARLGLGIRRGPRDRSDLGAEWASLSLQRHVAAHDQHWHDHRHVLDGVPDPEQPKP